MKEIPIWEKANLTLEEAAAYSGIGTGKLREITNDRSCNFVLWVGTPMWYHRDVISRLLLRERRSNGI